MKQTKRSMKMLVAGGLLLCVMSLGSCNKEAQTKPSAPDNVQNRSAAFDEAVQAATPLVWWKYDSTWKESMKNLVGTPHNGLVYSSTAQAKVGKAAFLSKENGFLSTATGPDFGLNLHGLTVDLWVYPFAKEGGAQCVFALPQTESFWPNMHLLTDGYNVAQGDSGLIKVMFKANKPGVTYIEQWTVVGGIPNFYRHWNHIQFAYNGETSQYTLIVNGEPRFDHVVLYTDGTNTVPLGDLAFINAHGFLSGAFQNQWDPVLFGSPEVWMLPYKGRIDNLKIFNSALF